MEKKKVKKTTHTHTFFWALVKLDIEFHYSNELSNGFGE